MPYVSSKELVPERYWARLMFLLTKDDASRHHVKLKGQTFLHFSSFLTANFLYVIPPKNVVYETEGTRWNKKNFLTGSSIYDWSFLLGTHVHRANGAGPPIERSWINYMLDPTLLPRLSKNFCQWTGTVAIQWLPIGNCRTISWCFLT